MTQAYGEEPPESEPPAKRAKTEGDDDVVLTQSFPASQKPTLLRRVEERSFAYRSGNRDSQSQMELQLPAADCKLVVADEGLLTIPSGVFAGASKSEQF